MTAITIRGNLVTPDAVIEGGLVRLLDGVIASVSPKAREASVDIELPPGGWIVPGFIDVHVHGGCGADFMDASTSAYETITAFHGRNGTTSLLATTVTAQKPNIDAVLEAAADYIAAASPAGARLLGVHLEGPFISPRWPGAQNPAFIVPPNAAWIDEWLAAYPGLIKLLTLAPETEGATKAIRQLTAQGVVVAAGHTDASYDQLRAAADAGLSHAAHMFNAMTGLHHREPGVVGATLTDPRIVAEVIADGVHVHPAAIQLLTQTKTAGNLLLITDAIAAAGLGDGNYNLGGLDVTVRDNVARLTHGNNLAGSTLTMIDAFRFMVRRIGLSVPEASRLASANPAKQLGASHTVGSIRPGAKADLVLLTQDLDIVAVYRDGIAIA
jgi:N-acetylglucosamine-6-phosphate deacetylase